MARLESNIFELTNLSDLNCRYRLYKVRGIPTGSDDFAKNMQLLVDSLSRQTKSPCISLRREENVYIAQPEYYQELPESFTLPLIRTAVKLEKEEKLDELQFDALSEEATRLAVRFLQFEFDNPLFMNKNLWRPKAGAPFYYKTPDPEFRKLSSAVDLYRGFSFRIVGLPGSKLGIAIDRSSKYVSRDPLPSNLNPDSFRGYKGYTVVYEYGGNWYEIFLKELSDLNCTEQVIEDKPLYELVHEKSANLPKSALLMKLPKDSSVVVYETSLGAKRFAPSALCRQTFLTNHPQIKKSHSQTIQPPHIRRQEIQYIVNAHFRNMKFNGKSVRLSQDPMSFEAARLPIPDLLFGNGKVLSANKLASLEDFPKNKKNALLSDNAGFFVKKRFDRQYFVIPRSVHESYGKRFLQDLKTQINSMYTTDSYEPTIIVYDDSVQKSAFSLGNEIINSVKNAGVEFGFGVVMVPRLPSRRHGKEDQLTNYAVRELRKLNLYASAIHTEIAENSLYEIASSDGTKDWTTVDDPKRKGRYRGYLSNVALNKIFLLNNIYPFILATPLHSDVIIGLDVKNHSAGFTLVSKNADTVLFEVSVSEQKEQLSKNHIKKRVTDLLDKYIKIKGNGFPVIRNILIHRDGRFFGQEVVGVSEAVSNLVRQGKLDKDCTCSFMEIKKTAKAPVRLFSVTTASGSQRVFVQNPPSGIFLKIYSEAFLVNTGPPYTHKGTVKPLHLVWQGGSITFEEAIEDTFKLSNLTWTKIDDCSRIPLSLKMTDIHLREVAGEYDGDAFKFLDSKGGDENE